MLIRFVIENILSFREGKEFTTIPDRNLKTLKHHLYESNVFDVLKLSSMYGANAAGKSNFIKALSIFQKIIVSDNSRINFNDILFKFNKHIHIKNNDEDNQDQILAIEFIQDDTAYYYAVKINNNIILKEELYLSGLGKKEDKLIFERTTDINKQTDIKFNYQFENDEKSQVLKQVLLEDFVSHNYLVFKLLANRDNPYLLDVKKAYKWFAETLLIVLPESKPINFINKFSLESNFEKFTNDIFNSLNLGIHKLIVDDLEIDEKSEYYNKIIEDLKNDESRIIQIGYEQEYYLDKENKPRVKVLKTIHSDSNNNAFEFFIHEESDGTRRIFEYIPAFYNLINSKKVVVIDEIERSIHPILIKNLITKFSLDEKTQGQLIFSTHESNLLDQKIFRKDEIWFAEKNNSGETDLYSLAEFKNLHKTIDIQKGYLNGRYGSIPFLGNFEELKWDE